jgi:hypothetical protein
VYNVTQYALQCQDCVCCDLLERKADEKGRESEGGESKRDSEAFDKEGMSERQRVRDRQRKRKRKRRAGAGAINDQPARLRRGRCGRHIRVICAAKSRPSCIGIKPEAGYFRGARGMTWAGCGADATWRGGRGEVGGRPSGEWERGCERESLGKRKKGATIDSFNKHPCNADMHCIALIAYNTKIVVSSFRF